MNFDTGHDIVDVPRSYSIHPDSVLRPFHRQRSDQLIYPALACSIGRKSGDSGARCN